MFNEPDLSRLFAQARKPLADDLFLANVLSKIDRARRARLWRQIFVAAVAVIIVSLNLRPVLEMTASAVRFAGELLPSQAGLLVTPWGWAVSMLIGAWVVFRTRSARR